MKKLNLWFLDKEINEISKNKKDLAKYINKHIEKYKNSLFVYENNSWWFKSRFNNSFENIVINVSTFSVENDNDIETFFEYILKKSFESVRENFKTNVVDDYEYREKDDNYLNRLKNNVYYNYENFNDIFDLITESFIVVLSVHKLRNGNKRFSYIFLITLLNFFGFYLRGSITKNDYLKSIKDWHEIQLFCFVMRLSNRTYNDLLLLGQKGVLDVADKKTLMIQCECLKIIEKKRC